MVCDKKRAEQGKPRSRVIESPFAIILTVSVGESLASRCWKKHHCQCEFRLAFLIPVQYLVTGLPRDPELPAQEGHAFPLLQPNHEPHPFVHNRTFLPWHPPPPAFLKGKKCNPCLRDVLSPMSQAGHSFICNTCLRRRASYDDVPKRPLKFGITHPYPNFPIFNPRVTPVSPPMPSEIGM